MAGPARLNGLLEFQIVSGLRLRPGRTLWRLCAVLLAAAAITSVSGQQQTQERWDFQEFINNTPVIQEMIFSIEKPPLKIGDPDRMPTRFYLVRWQDRGEFFALSAPSLTNLTTATPGLVATMEGYSAGINQWWKLEVLPDLFVVHTWDPATPPEECCNGVLSAVNTFRHVNLERVLAMGISYAVPGDVHWIGDNYRFTNREDQVEANGVLERDSEGRPSTLRHTFRITVPTNDKKKDTRVARHRIEYDYEANSAVPAGFPSEIRTFVLRDSESPFFNDRIKIHSLVLSTNVLASHQLLFRPIIKGFPYVVYVVSNKTEYSFDGKEWVEKVSLNDPHLVGDISPPSKSTRTFAVVVLLAPAVLLVFFLWRKKHSSQRPQQ